MLIKHKILNELYQVNVIDREANFVLTDIRMSLDNLRKNIKAKERDFQNSLDVLYFEKEIEIDLTNNTVEITSKGIISLGNKIYYNEHIRLSRDRTYFWLKIIATIAIMITIILGTIQIVDHFTHQPQKSPMELK